VPELPEVEVVRRGLARWVTGWTVSEVDVLHPRAVRRHPGGALDLSDRLHGSRLGEARRRGKYLWLPLDSGEALLVHLGMSGQLLVHPSGVPDEKHLRVRLRLRHPAPVTSDAPDAGERELRFVDQRTFGALALSDARDGLPAAIAHLAPDPFEPAFDDDAFAAALRRRRTGLKRALLDQTVVSGVGNIYADEGLWRARLHYARPTETLSRAEAARVLAGVREVMAAALAEGGTSFDSLYVDVNGDSGWFGRSLEVYGRAGRPCSRCGTPIRREAFMNRSSFSCPRCQPRPRRARW
jgi:formamidopyrimidine-DNA glycosylase